MSRAPRHLANIALTVAVLVPLSVLAAQPVDQGWGQGGLQPKLDGLLAIRQPSHA